MYEDKTMTCKDCNSEFIFTAGEQEFYAEKGFQNEPGRYPDCRRARKQQRTTTQSGPRESFDTTCAACGAPVTVPLIPRNDRPIYCSECFAARRNQRDER